MKFIETTLILKSIPKRGIHIHPSLGEVIIWRQHEFHSWWNLFESKVRHPLSRTLINGFVDSLEFNRTMPPITGLFRKRKFHKEMEQILKQLGWGTFHLERQNIVHSAHPLLSVALGQYLLERYYEQRFKVRWVEPRPQTVQLETEASSQLPHPQSLEPFPWSKGHDLDPVISSLSINLHAENELRFEGERVLLIPLDSFDRFYLGCFPYVSDKEEEWFDSESAQLDSRDNLLKLIIQSISDVFLESERPVYIIDESSWTAYIEHYICERGWGVAQITEYNPTTFTLDFTIPMQSQFPYTLGLMCGMWERAHGRAYRVILGHQNDNFVVKIQSLLEYDNQ